MEKRQCGISACSAKLYVWFAAALVLTAQAWAAACTGPRALEEAARGKATPQAFAALGTWFDQHTQASCAADAYRDALKLDPRFPAALHGLGKIYLGQMQYAQTVALLQNVPRDEESTVNVATAYDKLGDSEEASATLIRAIRANPASARLTGALVLFLANHGQFDEAYGVAEKFAKLHPHDGNAQKVYLRVLVATNDAAASRPLARRLLAASPGDSELLYLNGILERKAGEFTAARDHLRQSVAQDPAYPDSRYNLGLTLQGLGDTAGALEQLQRAIALGLADPEARLALSKLLRASGATSEADKQLALYQQAMQANASREIAASKSAEAQQALDKGDAVKAVALYREAAEAAPQDGSLAYRLSVALDRTGDVTAERAALEQAVKLDPSSAPAQHQLGYLFSQGGDNDGAELHFRAALQADPAFTQAWISLAATLAMKSQFPAAQDAVTHALRIEPHNAQALQMKTMLLASGSSRLHP